MPNVAIGNNLKAGKKEDNGNKQLLVITEILICVCSIK
jgi:hypothetical protein